MDGETSRLDELLDQLANNLVWKLGKYEGSERVVIRLGYASSTPNFTDQERLKNVGNAELEAALKNRDFDVEWVS